MKPTQTEIYAERIKRVVDRIEIDIGAGSIPSLADMAGAAAMSEYHFHRIFRLMTGETPAETVTRVRLACSLKALAAGDLSQAIDASGYATGQAFSRVMKSIAGATPSELRSDPDLLERTRARLSAPMIRTPEVNPEVKIAVCSLEPLRVLSLRNVGDYAALNVGFGALFDAICEQIDPSEIQGIYGVPWDDPRYTPAEACRFDCAFAVGNQGSERDAVFEIQITSGRYCRMEHFGDYDAIHASIDDLYRWAVLNNEEIAQDPLFIHYLDDPDDIPPEDQRAVVWLPLRKVRS